MKFLWIDDWQPIATAPDGVEIILAWTTGDHWRKGANAEVDWIWTAGTLLDGEWVEGPGSRPDWWMDHPPAPPDIR